MAATRRSDAATLTPAPGAHDWTLTRTINAPRELVFKAWTDPAQMARWWGPHGFTIPVSESDSRVGGQWRIVMRSPEGVDLPMDCTWREIVPPERLVYSNSLAHFPPEWLAKFPLNDDGTRPTEAVHTVTFEDAHGKTKLTIRTHHGSAAQRDLMAKSGKEQGWIEMLEKLETILSPDADREMVIARVVSAPRDLVWDAWTDPKQIVQWWGPNGFTNSTKEMAVRVGGTWRFVMHGPDGTDYPNRITYTEVVKHERLAYDHDGDVDATMPGFRTVVTFDELAGGKTKVTMRATFPTAGALAFVVQKHGAIEGGNQTLARLDKFLAQP